MVNFSRFRYSADRFKQIEYRSTDSWFGVFLSLLVAPGLIGWLTYELYLTESKIPYVVDTEAFSTTAIFANDSWVNLKCQAPSGCFYKHEYTDRGITERCKLVATNALPDGVRYVDKWQFAPYGGEFLMFACVTPSPHDGLFVVSMRKPFHFQCSHHQNHAQCTRTFMETSKNEGWMPCDVQHDLGNRRLDFTNTGLTNVGLTNVDFTKFNFDIASFNNFLGSAGVMNVELTQEQVTELSRNKTFRESFKDPSKSKDEKIELMERTLSTTIIPTTRRPSFQRGTKRPTPSPTFQRRTKSPTPSPTNKRQNLQSRKRNSWISLDAGDDSTNDLSRALNCQFRIDDRSCKASPSTASPQRYTDTRCFADEKLWPLFYRYEGQGGKLEPMIHQKHKQCLGKETCDFTQAFFPYSSTIGSPLIMDAQAIFAKKGEVENRDNPLSSKRSLCEAVNDFRGENEESALKDIPLHYGTHMLTFRTLSFKDYACTDNNGKAFMFKSSIPQSRASVDHINDFTPTPVSAIDGIPAFDLQSSDKVTVLAFEEWEAGLPDPKKLYACMRGEAKGANLCGNERYEVSKQIIPDKDKQNRTLKLLYHKDPRRELSPEAPWDDSEFLYKMYTRDHLSVTRMRFLPTFRKTTITRKDYFAILVVALGGYLSLALVGGRMASMLWMNCCRAIGCEIDTRDGREVKKALNPLHRGHALSADARAIEMMPQAKTQARI